MLLALKAGISISPPVPFLNRAQLFGSGAQGHNQSAQAWQGQRSGRVFRSVHSGKPVYIYVYIIEYELYGFFVIDMSVPYNQLLISDEEAGGIAKPTKLTRQQWVTELLHCCRPLIHCKQSGH